MGAQDSLVLVAPREWSAPQEKSYQVIRRRRPIRVTKAVAETTTTFAVVTETARLQRKSNIDKVGPNDKWFR